MRVDQREPRTDLVVADQPTSDAAVSPSALAPRRDTQRWWSPLWLFLAADLVALALTAVLAGSPAVFAVAATVAAVLSLRMANLYRASLLPPAISHAGTVTMAMAAGALAAAAATGATSTEALRFAALTSPAVCVGRGIAYAIHRRARVQAPIPAIIVGAGRDGQELASRLLDHPELGIRPLGFVDSEPGPIDPTLPVPVLGPLDALLLLTERHRVGRIFLDSGSVSETELLEVLDRASGLDVEISVVPALTQHLSTSIAVESVAGTTVLSYRPSRHHGISWTAKRAIDLVGAVAMLVASAPIWLVVALAIRLDSPGPILFRQTRVGRHGKPFTIYKFRSMQDDADAKKTLYIDLNDASGPYFKLESDPRVTRVGRIIRRFSIDEIPQVLNVLRGDMSLVGPRPALAAEVAEYPEWFRRRLTVRPGLSGLWQVSGRFLVPFAEATRLDVSYVDHWSLALDLQILARTPAVVLSGRGAR